MRGWWREMADLVLPAECEGCGRAGAVLCSRCRAALTGTEPWRARPDPEPPGLPAVHAATRYGDEVRAALLAHKERGALALTGPLGAALAGAVRAGSAAAREGPAAGRGAVLLVPVPSARRAVRARGHDPVRRIALAAAGELRRSGTPARVLAVLRQRHAVADQSGLAARERLENLRGALAVVRGGGRLLSGGGPVVLVDDLMTTGASLAEAARAVRASRGAERGLERYSYGSTKWSVYPSAAGEGREERKAGPATEEGPNGGGDVVRDGVRAAVVAASPDASENRLNSLERR
ncbi:ComF family protein [Streptomyces sp. NPDC048182]|uniref:ComF family protein n=1 Tax=Streptomyces sp. NPDC048182 TaxID=3365507 RepID=UPI003717CF41